MPTKPKKSKSPDSQFLFVNEDASTVTRTTKDAELDRTKQSHVQRQNFARKRRLREQSISGLPASTSSSVSPSPAVADPAAEASSSHGAQSHGTDYFDIIQSIDLGDAQFQSSMESSLPQDPLDPQLSSIFSDPFASTSSPPAIPLQPTSGFGSSHQYAPGPFFHPGASQYSVSSSPRGFTSLASPPIPLSRISSPVASNQRILEQWAPPLIQHYNTIVLPEKFWTDVQKVPMGQMRHASAIHADMRACMAEPAHMYAFLASAATQMLATEGRLLLPGVSEEDYQRVPTFFKTRAIQALRAKLAIGQLDHHIAVDVHRLYTTGMHAGNYEVAEPHFQALLSMVDSLGGLATFDDYQLEKMIMLDCNVALQHLGIPRFLATWDAGHLTAETLVDIESQLQQDVPVGSGMETAFHLLDVDGSLAEVFSDIIQVLKVSTYLQNAPHYVPENYRWFNLQALTILHRLLSMPLHCDMDDQTDSLRIATAYWTATLRAPGFSERAIMTSTHMLRAKLENTDLEYLWQPHTDCLLWVAVFGGFSATSHDDVEWYTGVARRAARQLGVGNAVELEELFLTLLYNPHSQRDILVRSVARIWPAAHA
jgi:hypothetical protein